MRRIVSYSIVLLVTGCVMISAPPASVAAEASADAAVYSAYVWRGQVINDELVVQPAFSASSENGLGLNAWGNVDLTDNFDQSGEFTEVDLTISYGLPLEGPVSVEVGLIEYLFPKTIGDDDTREIYISLGADAALSPSVSVYYDIDEVDGAYITGSLSQTINLCGDLSVDAGVSVAFATSDYNEAYFGVDDNALNDVDLSVSTSYALGENASLGAEVHYMFLPDSAIADGASDPTRYGDDDQLWGGVSLSLTL